MPTYTITVTSPNGSESYNLGSTQSITWTSTENFGDYCFISLYVKQGQDFVLSQMIAEGVLVSAESYSWTIPTDLAIGRYKVKISASSNSSINDMSDAEFSINAEPITITVANNGNQTYYFGDTTIPITWTWTGNLSKVNLKVRVGAGSWIVLRSNIDNIGSFSWSIVESQTPAGYYVFAVYNAEDESIVDSSSDIFNISGSRPIPTLNMITPTTSGVTYTKNSTSAIDYSVSYGDYEQFASSVFIQAISDTTGNSIVDFPTSETTLTHHSSSMDSITSAVTWTASGSYDWTVPLTDNLSDSGYFAPTPSSYKFRLSRLEYSSSGYGVDPIADFSNSSFYVGSAPSSINVTSPLSNDFLILGGSYDIYWESISLNGTVNIGLYSGNRLIHTIFDGVSTQGTNWSNPQGDSVVVNKANWKISKRLRPSINLRIKITSNSSPSVYGWSNNFSLITLPSSFFSDISIFYVEGPTSTIDWGFDNRNIDETKGIDNTLLSKTKINSNSFVASSICTITWKKLFTKSLKGGVPTSEDGWFLGKNISSKNNDGKDWDFPTRSFNSIDTTDISSDLLDKTGSVIIALYRKSSKYAYGVDRPPMTIDWGFDNRGGWDFPLKSFY